MRHILQAAVSEGVYASSELPCHLFVGGPASGHQHYVKTSESCYRDEEQPCHAHHSQCDDGVQPVDVLPVVEDEEEAEPEHGHDVSRERQQEQEEVSVVPAADAVVHPGTVVVELLHTVVTDGAVGAARGSVEPAGRAPLHPHLDPSDLHRFIQRGAEVVLFVLVLLSSGEDAGVHEGGHAEVCQHEQKDDAIVNRDSHGESLGQPRTREAEEERGGADQEEGRRGHGDVARGSEGPGRRHPRVRQGRGGRTAAPFAAAAAPGHRGPGGERGCEATATAAAARGRGRASFTTRGRAHGGEGGA